MDPFRIHAVDCSVNETYLYNEKFTCVKGKEFWRDGQIYFHTVYDPGISKYYRTCFGPAVSTVGNIYDDSNWNVNIAIRRLTGVKKPDEPGLDALMARNQVQAFSQASDFLDSLRVKYAPYFADYTTVMEEAIEHHADKHEKRELRIHGMDNLLNGDGNIHGNWIRRNRTMWKLKKGEWAKPGKKPRMIVDLGVEASLFGFRLTNYLKLAQDGEPIRVNGGVIRFCKAPDMDALEDVFRNLIELEHRFYFVYFSDDACLSVRMKDGSIRFFNLDISSCDASHGPSVFEALLQVVPDHVKPDMKILISQCSAPLKITNRENAKESVVLVPKQPMLYSGWTGTTAINNLANIMIAYQISQLDDFENQNDIGAAALRAGYIVTGYEKPLDSYTKLQFLKHSPVYDIEGHLRPMLNLGVLLRASGMCNYDLPGRKTETMEDRAKKFQRGLIQGAYPRTEFELLKRMRATCGEGEAYKVTTFNMKVGIYDKYPSYEVADTEMYKRYDFTPLEQEVFVASFGSCRFGELHSSLEAGKILTLDYDLACSFRTPDKFILTSR